MQTLKQSFGTSAWIAATPTLNYALSADVTILHCNLRQIEQQRQRVEAQQQHAAFGYAALSTA
jgi:hypothetical protein